MKQRKSRKWLVLCLLVVGMPLAAQNASNEKLKELVRADQADRSPAHIDWPAVDRRDMARATEVMTLLRSGKVLTAEDFYNAAMVFQHGASAENIQLAHALATVAARLAPEHPSPKWLAAAAWDRYMMWKKQPQWYGTQSQILKDTGKKTLYPVLPGVISDAERAAAGVPPIATIISDIEAENKTVEIGQEPAGIEP